MPSPTLLFTAIDFLGVFVAAVGGALEAVRNKRFEFDVIGVTGLAFVSALGGGILRDVLVQAGPPLAFRNPVYILVALAGAAVGLLFRGSFGPKTEKLLFVVDAAALGLFAVTGSTRGLANGLSFLPSMLLGGTTAVGGGAMRDVLSGTTPRIFIRGQFHAIAALSAAVIFLLAYSSGMGQTVATMVGVSTAFIVRLASVRFDWQTAPVRKGPAEE